MVSSRRRRGHRSDSGRSQSGRSRSGSLSGSTSSRADSAVRSRAQSLIHSIEAASRSSLDLIQSMRSHANSSMARLEEDMAYSTDSRSRSGSEGVHSSNENYTFGVNPPVRQSSRSQLSEAAFIADAVKRSPVAHVFYFYSAPGFIIRTLYTHSHITKYYI
jgi:hypothetical protein